MANLDSRAVLVTIALLVGVMPAGADPAQELPHNQGLIPIIPTPVITDDDRMAAEQVAAMPNETLEARIARWLAARHLSDGAQMALAEEDPWTVGIALFPTSAGFLRLLETFTEEEIHRLVEQGELTLMAEELTPVRRAIIEEQAPNFRAAFDDVKEIQFEVFKGNLLRCWYILQNGGVANIVIGPIQTPGFRRLVRLELHRHFHGGPPLRASYWNWEVQETDHLRFHFAPRSQVAQMIDLLAADYERALLAMCQEAQIAFPQGPIDIWLYDDRAHKSAMGQPSYNFADAEHREIHSVSRGTPGHEVAHVVFLHAWGPPGTGLMSEGAAMMFNGHFDTVKRARRELPPGRVLPVGELVDCFGCHRERVRYLEAGAFAAFVFEVYGLEVFRETWAVQEPTMVLAEATGKPWEQVETDFLRWVYPNRMGKRCPTPRPASVPQPQPRRGRAQRRTGSPSRRMPDEPLSGCSPRRSRRRWSPPLSRQRSQVR